MLIILIIIFLAGISIGWAYWSLKQIQKGLGEKETMHTQESLKKERVIFHSSDVEPSSSS